MDEIDLENLENEELVELLKIFEGMNDELNSIQDGELNNEK